MTQKQLDPVMTGIAVALSTATAAGTLFSALGFAAASVVITGAAALGIFAGAWIWHKKKQMNQAIEENGLTPVKEAYPCGIISQKESALEKHKVRI